MMRVPRWILGILIFFLPVLSWATSYTLAPPLPYVTGEGIGQQRLDPPAGVQPTANYRQGIYIEGFLGYVINNWTAQNNNTTALHNAYGGLIYGADTGYHRRYLGLEIGGFIYPVQRFTLAGTGLRSQQYSAFLAGRLFIKLYKSLQVYAKLGLAYMQINMEVSAKKAFDRFEPIIGVGSSYYLTSSFSIQAQFTLIPGSESIQLFDNLAGDRLQIPYSYLFLVGLGYEFHF